MPRITTRPDLVQYAAAISLRYFYTFASIAMKLRRLNFLDVHVIMLVSTALIEV